MNKAKQVKLEWPELGESIVAEMLFGQNPTICETVWGSLPMESCMGHVVISGETVWFPTRIVHLGPSNPVKRQVGDVYFFASGQSICMTYGAITETAKVNKFAQVRPEDIPTLQRVGKLVLEKTINNAQRESVLVRMSAYED